jgi:hypothetical protein
MSERKRPIVRIFIITALLLTVTFFTGRYILFRQIRNALRDRVLNLQKDGIALAFDSLYLNPWNGSISVQNLNITINRDSSLYNIKVSIPALEVRGIRIMPFIIDHSLAIRKIAFTNPHITYRTSANLPDSKSRRAFLEGINIDDIRIERAALIVMDSLTRDSLNTASFDLNVRHLGLEKTGDSLAWYDAEVELRNAAISAPGKLYSFSIASAKLNLTDGELAIDSFRISPLYGKHKFMRLSGKQTDRIAGVIPKLHIHGLRFSHTPNLVVRVLSAELSFRLDVFRDKRFRFIKNHHTRLPMNFLQKLPFDLQADTLRLTDSYVKYQEFPENADSAGYVYFDHLRAVITNIHNDPGLNQDIVMNTQAEFMGKGDLNVRFTFPADTTKACKTTGSLRGFELARLNTMLGPAAKVRIESGVMTNLKFNFAYTMKRSDGLVEINYKNLKVSSLREKDDKAAISVVKTLVLNTFIIKKNMDENVDANDKTGTILFYRDTKRSIFNYWWKSVFSGIKSAYNIDKLPVASKNDNARDERREAEKKREKRNKKKDKDGKQ